MARTRASSLSPSPSHVNPSNPGAAAGSAALDRQQREQRQQTTFSHETMPANSQSNMNGSHTTVTASSTTLTRQQRLERRQRASILRERELQDQLASNNHLAASQPDDTEVNHANDEGTSTTMAPLPSFGQQGTEELSLCDASGANAMAEHDRNISQTASTFDPSRFGFGRHVYDKVVHARSSYSHQHSNPASNQVFSQQRRAVTTTTFNAATLPIQCLDMSEDEDRQVQVAIGESMETNGHGMALPHLGPSTLSDNHRRAHERGVEDMWRQNDESEATELLEKGKGRIEAGQSAPSSLHFKDIHVLLAPAKPGYPHIFKKNIQTAIGNLRFDCRGYAIAISALLRTIVEEPTQSFSPFLQDPTLLVATSRRFFTEKGFHTIENGYQVIGRLGVLLQEPPIVETEVISIDPVHPETAHLRAINCEPLRVFVLFLHETSHTHSDQQTSANLDQPCTSELFEQTSISQPPAHLFSNTLPDISSFEEAALPTLSDIQQYVSTQKPMLSNVPDLASSQGPSEGSSSAVTEELRRQATFVPQAPTSSHVYSTLANVSALGRVLEKLGYPLLWSPEWNKQSERCPEFMPDSFFSSLNWNTNTLKQRRGLYQRSRDTAILVQQGVQIQLGQHHNRNQGKSKLYAKTLYQILPSLFAILEFHQSDATVPVSVQSYLETQQIPGLDEDKVILVDVSKWSIRRFENAISDLFGALKPSQA
ncbi:hypothetical protein FRC02_001372 [Tulasnella sp. 418]|nr:hypothetical protein FRC02_001372 [Tulasnella sp. 418]